MDTRTGIAALSIVVGLLLLAWLFLRDGLPETGNTALPPLPGAPTGADPAPRGDDESARPRELSDPEGEPARSGAAVASDAPAPTWTLHCVDPASSPVGEAAALTGSTVVSRGDAAGDLAVPAAVAQVVCFHPDFVPSDPIDRPADLSVPLSVTLQPGRVIRGRVVNHNGDGIPGTAVTATCSRGLADDEDAEDIRTLGLKAIAFSKGRPLVTRLTETGATGAFEIRGLHEGPAWIACEKFGYCMDGNIQTKRIELDAPAVKIVMARVFVALIRFEGPPGMPSPPVSYGISGPDGTEVLPPVIGNPYTRQIHNRFQSHDAGSRHLHVHCAREREGIWLGNAPLRHSIKVSWRDEFPLGGFEIVYVPADLLTREHVTTISLMDLDMPGWGTLIVTCPFTVRANVWDTGSGASPRASSNGRHEFLLFEGSYSVRPKQDYFLSWAKGVRVEVVAGTTAAIEFPTDLIPGWMRLVVRDAAGRLTTDYLIDVFGPLRERGVPRDRGRRSAAVGLLLDGRVRGTPGAVVPASMGTYRVSLLDSLGGFLVQRTVRVSAENPTPEIELRYP